MEWADAVRAVEADLLAERSKCPTKKAAPTHRRRDALDVELTALRIGDRPDLPHLDRPKRLDSRLAEKLGREPTPEERMQSIGATREQAPAPVVEQAPRVEQAPAAEVPTPIEREKVLLAAALRARLKSDALDDMLARASDRFEGTPTAEEADTFLTELRRDGAPHLFTPNAVAGASGSGYRPASAAFAPTPWGKVVEFDELEKTALRDDSHKVSS